MAHLDRYQQWNVEQARKALAASQADTDHANYPRHLGVLEVNLADMIQLVEQLAGNV